MARVYESQEACPVACALNIIGDRWTLLVLRDLAKDIGRFKELLVSLDGISANLLADRLKRLEEHGIVERVFYRQHPPRAEYRLTAKGSELTAVIEALRTWGRKHALKNGGKRRSLSQTRAGAKGSASVVSPRAVV